MDDKYLWHIHGKRYDFRSFVHQHPAGPTMILMGQGRDCTELFESYHAMTDLPSKYLKAYEVRPDEMPFEEPSFHWDTTPFFDALKIRVRAHFVTTGRSHKASMGMWLRIVFGLVSLIVVTFFWLCGQWWTVVALPCIYWITCSLLLHSGGHSAISNNWRVNYYLSYFGCFHSSLTTWCGIFVHHVYRIKGEPYISYI
jgi:acyl-lipid (8-3)-desaturase